jgi:hypothetical protein
MARTPWLSVGAVVFTVVAIFFFTDISRNVLAILFGGWLIGPPLWFLWEWSKFTPTMADTPTEAEKMKFETFKYNQELAKNVWIAVSVILGFLLAFK